MDCNENYFNGSEKGYREYENFPHFKQRALWIQENLSGKILVVGCAYGYLVEELRRLGIEAYGVEKSAYAYSRIRVDIKKYVENKDVGAMVNIEDEFDWIVSWNALDCLEDLIHAQWVGSMLNHSAKNQLHILNMFGKNYEEDGYYIKPMEYWRELLPNAHLVCYDKRIDTPTGKTPFTDIPLCWGEKI